MLLPSIIGLPGSILDIDLNSKSVIPEYAKDTLITQYETFLIGHIYPAFPLMTTGEEVYSLDQDKGWSKFKEKLETYDIQINPLAPGSSSQGSQNIALAFQSQSSFAETFNNEFGPSESFLGNIQNALSMKQIWQEAEFITGSKSATGVLGKVADKMGFKGGAGGIKGGIADMAKGLKEGTGNLIRKMPGGNMIAGAINQKGKVDFPLVWKNSGMSANYELNIRLYNPSPKNLELQQQLITNPLIALAMFVSPWTDDGDFYQWPLLMRFEIKGLVYLKAAYCSGMTIVKGGDINDVAWNQRAGTVDVRMSINSLYSTCLNYDGGKVPKSEIPDLNTYKASLEDEKAIIHEPPPVVPSAPSAPLGTTGSPIIINSAAETVLTSFY